jgi:hypothetical protein
MKSETTVFPLFWTKSGCDNGNGPGDPKMKSDNTRVTPS